MKILFSKQALHGPVSGGDQLLIEYAAVLKPLSDVMLLTIYSPDPADRYRGAYAQAGVTVIAIADLKRYKWARLKRAATHLVRRDDGPLKLVRYAARRFLAKCRPDLVHVVEPMGGTTEILEAAADLGIPTLYQEISTPGARPEVEDWYRLLRAAIPRCSAVAALSPCLADSVQRQLKPNRPPFVLPLIASGVRRLPPRQNPDIVTFGYAGRLEPAKGLDLLMGAFSRLRTRNGRVRLLLAGSEPTPGAIKRCIEKFGIASACAVLPPYVDKVSREQFFSAIDILVHPSRLEGTPLAVIEALGFGRPVIATAVGGLPDMVDATVGTLIGLDELELASAMDELGSRPESWDRLSERGRTRYETHFSPESVAPLLEAVYRSLLGGAVTCPLSHPWAIDPLTR